MDEKLPWDQQDGESSRWFQRFSAFRLLGPGRSLIAASNAERVSRSLEKSVQTPGSWRKAAERWQWLVRAAAWDKHLTDQATEAVEARWRDKVMGQTEVLGRLSEWGRNDIRQFFKEATRWTDAPLPAEEILSEEEYTEIIRNRPVIKKRYLVRKVVLDMNALMDPELSYRVKEFSDSPKNGLSIKLHDAKGSTVDIGKHHKLFDVEEDHSKSSLAGSFSLPADMVAPAFLDVYRDIRDRKNTEYLFFGGRGSTKSSFISLAIVYILINNPTIHALVTRQISNTLRDSVYSQLQWAINELGFSGDFKCLTSPLEITYLPTGQKIYFRGLDDVGKIKSIKPAFGYLGVFWAEECDQMTSAESVRKVEQSLRGGNVMYFFKSWNPPRSSQSWINKYSQIPKGTQYKHSSNYLTVPKEWLGDVFLSEAEHLKNINPEAYKNEYLGEVTGTGGQVFENVVLRAITDEEISQFDHVLHGLDFGFYPDPAHYSRMHYDAARLTLYIFGEVRRWKNSNRAVYDALVEYGLQPDNLLICDSAEPKSVADFREYGASARGAEKGPESVKYSIKWFQSLVSIVIDNERCPYTAEEFLNFEYEQNSDEEFISEFPDKNNHAIDACRYGTNLIWRRRGQ